MLSTSANDVHRLTLPDGHFDDATHGTALAYRHAWGLMLGAIMTCMVRESPLDKLVGFDDSMATE